MNICPMCGAKYTPDEENAYYVTEDKTVCERCADAIDTMMTSDAPKAIRRAYEYIVKQHKIASDPEVKQYLAEIIENNEGVAEEMEYQEYKENVGDQPDVQTPFQDHYTYSTAGGRDLPYVVIQVTLKEKLVGTGSGNLSELQDVLNYYAYKGYRLHTMATSNGGSKGALGGDRIQATLVFEKK